MAKTGEITVGAGHSSQTANNTSVANKVAPPRPATGTLGSIVKNAQAGLAPAGLAIIDFAERKVGIGTRDADFYNYLRAKIVGLSGDYFEFVVADASKSSSGWAVKKNGTLIGQTLTGTAPTGVGLLLTDRFGFAAPTRTMESLVNSIEDALTEAGMDGVLLIDQVAETCTLAVQSDMSAVWTNPVTGSFASVSTYGTPAAFTVLADTTSAPGFSDGIYLINGGTNDGDTRTITSEVSDGPLGLEDENVTLASVTTIDSTARKVAVIDQDVPANETSGVGMFQS